MFKKFKFILKVVLVSAFISTWFYGYQYHSKKDLPKIESSQVVDE
jgi:hypothetical protein